MSNLAIYLLQFIIAALIFGLGFQWLSRKSTGSGGSSGLEIWGGVLILGGIISYFVGVSVILGAIVTLVGAFLGLIISFGYALLTSKRGLF